MDSCCASVLRWRTALRPARRAAGRCRAAGRRRVCQRRARRLVRALRRRRAGRPGAPPGACAAPASAAPPCRLAATAPPRRGRSPGSVTLAPSLRRSAPSVITCSPAFRPVAICDLVDGRLAARHRAQRHRALCGIEHVDEVAVGAVAQRRHRHHDRVLDGAQLQAHVDELAREQLAVCRWRSAPWRARCRSAHRPGCRARRSGRWPGSSVRVRSSAVTGSGAPSRMRACSSGTLVLRHREFDVDRRQLGDHGDAVGVAAADQVADVDHAQADAAR